LKAVYHSYQTRVFVQDYIISALPTTTATSPLWHPFWSFFSYCCSKNFSSTARIASTWPSQMKESYWHSMTWNKILYGM